MKRETQRFLHMLKINQCLHSKCVFSLNAQNYKQRGQKELKLKCVVAALKNFKALSVSLVLTALISSSLTAALKK